jgi:hypothetical protein
MMDWLAIVAGMGLYGFGMFLAGTISERKVHAARLERERTCGFRDGWEAAEKFDDDVRIVWGGRL